MMNRDIKESGFSAVELIITLFIAAMFVLAGYQLWLQVIDDGELADKRAQASAVAIQYLKRHKPAPGICTASTPQNNTSITIGNLSDPRVTVAIDCPHSSGSSPQQNLSRVTSTVTYGPTTERISVSHATYSR